MKKSFLVSAFVILLVLFIMSAGTYAFLRIRAADNTEAAAVSPTITPEAQTSTPEVPPPTEEPVQENTPEPVATEPQPDYSQRAQEILDELTLEEKVAQMMIVYPSDWQSEWTVGGLVYSESDIPSREAVIESINDYQSKASIPLFICADEEGGAVRRTRNISDIPQIESMLSYKDDGVQKAHDNAFTIASYMKELGFNLDLAPVADVHTNPNDTVINTRAYSDDFSQAAELIPYAVKGFHDGGIACCLKHFPGHGSAGADTHYGPADVSKTKEELMSEDLLPFISGIEAGADMVMVAHLTMTEIDKDRAASLSANVITGLLRKDLGYDGVVITDGLGMVAVSGNYSADEIAVMAVQAGNDILLGPENVSAAITAISNAVRDGTIEGSRIDESVLRILELKLEREIIK